MIKPNENYFCFKIDFVNLEYGYKDSFQEKKFHAHLYYQNEEEIELKLFYDEFTQLKPIIDHFIYSLGFENFGNYLNASELDKNRNLIEIDFSTSRLNQFTINHTNCEISLKLDKVRWVFDNKNQSIQFSEFILNDNGFKIIKDYYSIIFQNDENKFEHIKMKDKPESYEIYNCKMQFKFNYLTSSSIDKYEMKIIKVPILKFEYFNKIAETTVLDILERILILSSFYKQGFVDYKFASICINNKNINIRKVDNIETTERYGSFYSWSIDSDFDKILKLDWQFNLEKHQKKLKRIVELFIHAIQIKDNQSKLLMFYNLIEICAKNSDDISEVINIKEGYNKEEAKSKAFELLIQIISEEDKLEFENSWKNSTIRLFEKNLTRKINNYLKSIELPLEDLGIRFNKIAQVRGNITHGSLSITENKLIDINHQLYMICGAIILDMINIKKWSIKPRF